MKLLGRVGIVTGGSGYIGRTTVEELLKEGSNVVFTYMSNKQNADFLLDTLKKYKGQLIGLKCDARNFEDVKKVVRFTIDKFKKIDILVNNAGTATLKKIDLMTEEDWDRTIDVSLKGSFNFSKLVAPIMKEQHYGKIINIASINGIIGSKIGTCAHGTSKAGIIGFTKNLAVELAAFNINVNCIAPGIIRTSLNDEWYKKMAKLIPLQKVGETKDIAKAIVFLCSSDSDFITGETIVIDGGHTIALRYFWDL